MLQSRLPMVSICHQIHIVFSFDSIIFKKSSKKVTVLLLFHVDKGFTCSFPQDYYGVPFPGTAATLPGRDGLGNNPYSSKSHFLVDIWLTLCYL